MQITYRNSFQSHKQKPFLLLVGNGKLHLFSGRAIPGIVSVKERKYWNSGTTVFILETNNNVRAFTGAQLQNGCVFDSLCESIGKRLYTWTDYASELNVTIDEVIEFFKKNWPYTAQKVDYLSIPN
jgi:hypothetical protein